MLRVCALTCPVLLVACAAGANTPPPSTAGASPAIGAAEPPCPPALPPSHDATAGWPTDPQQLVAHLDGWNRDELELVARPALHPDQAPSGETNAWVNEHRTRLSAMGVHIAWNRTDRCFGIVSP